MPYGKDNLEVEEQQEDNHIPLSTSSNQERGKLVSMGLQEGKSFVNVVVKPTPTIVERIIQDIARAKKTK